MAKRKKSEHVGNSRPRPLTAKQLKESSEGIFLRYLLKESLMRYREARKLERDRKIIYPETTSILRDCERLIRTLRKEAGRGKNSTSEKQESPEPIIKPRKKSGLIG
ncbi:hypothetical protein [Leptospira stimsonii]|uniref:Transposase n=1 Tax=Leptospira stimsonii TaxID=2202203 RepID=A0ABY2N8Y2_9LEPT|nr:hypothetical protein [Leptospira stimsonii]TGK12849.1 hypothetical protein EHO98_19615 [Leptospira stimsonii]TGM18775.1 hypothetical protein EHQ90_06430 [Leptospira stimsonii]